MRIYWWCWLACWAPIGTICAVTGLAGGSRGRQVTDAGEQQANLAGTVAGAEHQRKTVAVSEQDAL